MYLSNSLCVKVDYGSHDPWSVCTCVRVGGGGSETGLNTEKRARLLTFVAHMKHQML